MAVAAVVVAMTMPMSAALTNIDAHARYPNPAPVTVASAAMASPLPTDVLDSAVNRSCRVRRRRGRREWCRSCTSRKRGGRNSEGGCEKDVSIMHLLMSPWIGVYHQTQIRN